MGRAARAGRVYTHRVVTCGRVCLTRVAVTPFDPIINTLRVAADDGWYDGRVVRLPSWTGIRTGLGVAVHREVANVPLFLGRLLLELTLVALAVWLALS